MAIPLKEIRFLAVARRTDNAILAHRVHTADKSYDYLGVLQRIMASPGWQTVTRDKLSLNDGAFVTYVLIDEAQRVYVAMTTNGYPSRYIYASADGATRGVLSVLKKEILERYADVSLSCSANGLNSKAQPLLKALCDEFNDLKSIDKMAAVQGKVDAVAGVMQKNIELALKNADRIEDIDEKAVNLAEAAEAFKNKGGQLKRHMRCRYYKMMLLFGLVIAAVLAAIIGYFVSQNSSSSSSS